MEFKSERRKVSIIIDSNSRFAKKNRLWQKLPHDEYGWNRFEGYCIDNFIWYKGKRVIDLNDIKNCYKGLEVDDTTGKKYHWFYFFISPGELTDKDKEYAGNFVENRILYFNFHPMTDAHVHFKVFDE